MSSPMTPALAPFYARWLRIEEAKLFAEIALAGLDPDAAWEAFRAEAERDRKALASMTIIDEASVMTQEMWDWSINRSKKSQAKASEDNGRISGECAGPVTGEASRQSRGCGSPAPIQESERPPQAPFSLPAGSGTDEIPATNPVANVGEEQNGAMESAACSADPASRGAEVLIASSPRMPGFSGEDDGRHVEATGGAAPVITNPALPMARKNTLRPLCQRPANCGGYGAKTCHACLVAAGEAA